MRRYFNYCVFILLVFISYLSAGTTGKIAGIITDGRIQEPLIGANVVIKNTFLGASTDLDGNFAILNVPPGTYVLEIMYIGYQTKEIQNVKVSTDLTTRLDITLSEETLESTEVVSVVATRPVVQRDLTATTSVVSSKEIEALPVTEVSDVLALQAGYVDGHMRGGRSGEVAIWIDGIPVTDAYDGGSIVDVNKNMVSELQVISGAYNAEYGNAMSGIVNIVTKQGSDKISGTFTTYFGDNLSSHKKIFWGIDEFNPLSIRDFDLSLNGPIVDQRLFYFVNARHIYFGGWLNGKNTFKPGNVPGFNDSLGVVVPSINPAIGQGNNDLVPMNWNRKNYGQMKLLFKPTNTITFTSSSIYENFAYQDYDRNYKLNPKGNLQRFREGLVQMFKMTHTLSPTTFYDLGVTGFFKTYQHYTYEDANDPRYVHPNVGSQFPFRFKTGGTDNNRFNRQTTTYLAKFDLTSQLGNIHQLKTGLEYKQHEIYYKNVNMQPQLADLAFDPFDPFIRTEIQPDSSINTSSYTNIPTEASFYIQDKMEFDDFVLNIGIRLDYFDPDGRVLADPTDPQIYSPIKVENRFHDYNENGIQDDGEPKVTIEERRARWYKKAKDKLQISPRIGAAFPISSRGKLYFSYGYFFQRASFERLYTNPDFDIPQTEAIPLVGNSDLRAEKTIQGELGIQQQITDDISIDATIFFRDIRDLTGTRADLIEIFGSAKTYAQFKNSDFGLVKGFVLAFNKRFSGGFSSRIDYTFQKAQGTASNPDDALNQTRGGNEPEVQIKSLSWDQRHTINATASYNAETWGGSIIAKYGSGLPYTPQNTIDISSILTNSSTKPATNNVDLRAYKNFQFFGLDFNAFLRVLNLFDRLNETGVYNDTGRAGKTIQLEQARTSTGEDIEGYYNPLNDINTLDEWFTNATHYNEPRRVEFGLTINF